MKVLNDRGLIHQVVIIKSLFGDEESARINADQALGDRIDALQGLVSLIPRFGVSVVQTLPTQDIATDKIYLVPSNGTTGNLYTEYIYVDGNWETLGQANVQLELVTNAQIDAIIAGV